VGIMQGSTVTFCGGDSFLERQFMKLQVSSGVKECQQIKKHLKQKGEVRSEDFKFNVIIPSAYKFTVEKTYFVTKGYNKDGSLKPIKRYSLKENKIVEEQQMPDIKIVVLDLYEKSIVIYDFEKDEKYITGYFLREHNYKNEGTTLVLTKEKVKVLLKNINAQHEYNNLDNFIDRFML
jgi:hypothetical protein